MVHFVITRNIVFAWIKATLKCLRQKDRDLLTLPDFDIKVLFAEWNPKESIDYALLQELDDNWHRNIYDSNNIIPRKPKLLFFIISFFTDYLPPKSKIQIYIHGRTSILILMFIGQLHYQFSVLLLQIKGYDTFNSVGMTQNSSIWPLNNVKLLRKIIYTRRSRQIVITSHFMNRPFIYLFIIALHWSE